MGKLRYDPHHFQYPHQQSKTLKAMNNTLKKSVKITYISSPLLVRTCDASDFRSVVQQLTGKNSDDLISESPHKAPHPPTWSNQFMQVQGGDARATTATAKEDGNALSYYNNRPTDSVEFDEDYFWKEVARSVLRSPCVLV